MIVWRASASAPAGIPRTCARRARRGDRDLDRGLDDLAHLDAPGAAQLPDRPAVGPIQKTCPI